MTMLTVSKERPKQSSKEISNESWNAEERENVLPSRTCSAFVACGMGGRRDQFMATAHLDEERTNDNGQKDEGEQRGREGDEDELANKIEVRMTPSEERPRLF